MLSKAQSVNTILDVFSGNKVEYQTHSIDLNKSPWSFYNSIDLEYPELINLPNNAIQSTLNKRFKYLVTDQLESDSFRIQLFKCSKGALDTYLKLHNKLMDDLGIYSDNKNLFSPTIENVQLTLHSLKENILTFSITYSYKLNYERYSIEDQFYFYQVYYFDLKTGKQYLPKDVFSAVYNEDLMQLVRNKIEKSYHQLDVLQEVAISYEDVDWFPNNQEEGGYQTQSIPEGSRDFSFVKDGVFAPSLNCFYYHLPACNPATIGYFGIPLTVQLSYEEIKKYLNPNGPFAFLMKKTKRNKAFGKNLNPPDIFNSYNPYQSPIVQITPFEYNLMYKNCKQVKRITIEQLRIDNYQKKKSDTLRVPIKRYNFNSKHLLSSIQSVEDYGVKKVNWENTNTELFYYNTKNNLIKRTNYNGKVFESTIDYVYDTNNNLLVERTTDHQHPIKTKKYLYFKNECYIEEPSVDDLNSENLFDFKTTRIKYNEKNAVDSFFNLSNPFYDVVYRYNALNQPTTVIGSDRYTPFMINYIYDKNHNLIANESDKADNRTEYKYDASNQLIETVTYRNQNSKGKSTKIQYDTKGKPTMVAVSTFNEYSGEEEGKNYYYFVYEE
jgi:YD repeat-containing protein